MTGMFFPVKTAYAVINLAVMPGEPAIYRV